MFKTYQISFLLGIILISIRSEILSQIHMIWLDGNIPEKYIKYIEECKSLNPTYNLSMWNNEDIYELMRNEYAQFIDLYNQLESVEKTDLARLMILHSKGGIYMDIDHKCLNVGFINGSILKNDIPDNKAFTNESLGLEHDTDVLLRRIGFGLSNSFMASKKGSDFVLRLMERIDKWRFRYLRSMPYVHTMISSGPFALSSFVRSYGGQSKITLISNDAANEVFLHFREGLWHRWDGKVFFFLNNHTMMIVPLVCVFIGFCFRMFMMRRRLPWRRNIRLNLLLTRYK
ncbi:hypothetical protein ACOME3_007970 [Neoechinorhynchus agilis]